MEKSPTVLKTVFLSSWLPSGHLLHSYGISMAMLMVNFAIEMVFHGSVILPEGMIKT